MSDHKRGLWPFSSASSYSMSGFGGDGTCGGADEEPLGGAANAAPRAATARDPQSVVAFAGECCGFATFIGEISLGRGKFCLAGFAVESEIIERF